MTIEDKIRKIINQHKSFNQFMTIPDQNTFISEHNIQVAFHFKDEDENEFDYKIKQSCYIKDNIPFLKTKLYIYNPDKKKWEMTKKNIKFIESILEDLEWIEGTEVSEFQENFLEDTNKQMTLF